MSRIDISEHLVHWTSGEDYEHAYMNLMQILVDMRISGSLEKIKGSHYCICFTEAPEMQFHKEISRYSPFGIQVPKKWLYAKGGRPVIYQSDAEYELLPQEMRWRHVRYEPNATPPIDFTWEREWRINEYELALEIEQMRVLLPNEYWAEIVQKEYLAIIEFEAQFGALAYGEAYNLESENKCLNYSIIGA